MSSCDVTIYNTLYALFTFGSTAFVVVLGALLALVVVAALFGGPYKPRR